MSSQKRNSISPELIELGRKEVLKNKKYQKLNELYKEQTRTGQYAKAMYTKQQIDKLSTQIVCQFVENIERKRERTENILEALTEEDRVNYKIMVNCLCFCFDTMESIFNDINDIFKRNELGLISEQLPEIIKCRERVSNTVANEFKDLKEKAADEYMKAADDIYSSLIERCKAFRGKLGELADEV